MKFVESEKSGTVLGNKVKAKPVPFSVMRSIDAAQGGGDRLAVVEAMGRVVASCVTMGDGSPIDVDGLSVGAISELFNFAIGNSSESVADFT